MNITAPNAFRIAFVEDDPDDIYLLRSAFLKVREDVDLAFVDDGLSLLSLLDKIWTSPTVQLPDLIIMDLNMPRLNGLDTLVRLKAHPIYRILPVVIYTTSNSEADIRDSYLRGASSYIVKPGSYSEILNTLKVFSDYWFNVCERISFTSFHSSNSDFR